jgi:hypothetical protein
VTYTFATMEVPRFVHALVRQLLLDAKYDHVVDDAAGTLDMTHIALVPGDAPDPLEDMRAAKDGAYLERNRVVAALACCFPAGVGRTAIEGWDPEWENVVYIDLPTGQVSWHFHDDHAHLFASLQKYPGTWDGHDTPEKYRRVAALVDSAHPSVEHWRQSFQPRVGDWLVECFGREVANDVRERGDRLLEEVLELLQSHGYDRTRVPTLTDYVYSRPPGSPHQEMGGVMVTLAAYGYATQLDMFWDGIHELMRITKPDVMDRIREKQATKRGLHTPLPVHAVEAGGCAPPVVVGDFGIEIGATQHGSSPDREPALVLLESTANMLRGMTLDPEIPDHAKHACQQQAAEIDALTDAAHG